MFPREDLIGAELAVLLLGEHLPLLHHFDVAGVHDHVRLEVQHPLEVTHGDVEKLADA